MILSAHDVSEGGIAVSLFEKLTDTGLGANIHIESKDKLGWLFSEAQHRWIISTRKSEKITELFGDEALHIGEVSANATINIFNENILLSELESSWKYSIDQIMNQA